MKTMIGLKSRTGTAVRSGVLLLAVIVALAPAVYAGNVERAGRLSPEEQERVRVLKLLVRDVDTKSLQETITELEESADPRFTLRLREAMARTYADIVRDRNITDQKQKEWIYSRVAMNMAFLQFGANEFDAGKSGSLNSLIHRKLKEHLPPEILSRPDFRYRLE